MRKLIWTGIILGLIPLYMGAACGGYVGWPGLTTAGADAKVTQELSVSSTGPLGSLESGLWLFYVNYNNVGQQKMKTVSTFVDHTAPFGVFTSDGLLEQHFSDHVGVLAASAIDKNGDGVICWIGCPFEAGDYTIPNAFCPAVGGTGTPSTSNGFAAYCTKGVWETIVASTFSEETKQSSPGSKYSNSLGDGSNFSPITLGKIMASSTLLPDGNGLAITVNSISLPNGASYTLTTPAGVTSYGLLHGLAVNADQPGLVEAASWLASQWAGQPDGAADVSLTVNGGAATIAFKVASGNNASIVLQNFAATH